MSRAARAGDAAAHQRHPGVDVHGAVEARRGLPRWQGDVRRHGPVGLPACAPVHQSWVYIWAGCTLQNSGVLR